MLLLAYPPTKLQQCAYPTVQVACEHVQYLSQCLGKKNTTSATCRGRCHHMCKYSIRASVQFFYAWPALIQVAIIALLCTPMASMLILSWLSGSFSYIHQCTSSKTTTSSQCFMHSECTLYSFHISNVISWVILLQDYISRHVHGTAYVYLVWKCLQINNILQCCDMHVAISLGLILCVLLQSDCNKLYFSTTLCENSTQPALRRSCTLLAWN